MPTKRPTAAMRAALAGTTPNPPYAVQPTRTELVEALRRAADHDLTASQADVLLEREARARAWAARIDGLRTALVGHYGSGPRALRCPCKFCEDCREELKQLYAQRAAISESR